jgi:acyl carrier protein
MIPAAFVFVDRLPLTPNGKLDRGALPRPDYGALLAEGGFVSPRTAAEMQIAEIWRTVLGVRPGINQDFFLSGGNSILAARVVSAVRDAYDIELPLKSIFDHPTIAALAEIVEEEIRVDVARMSEAQVRTALAGTEESTGRRNGKRK